MTFEFEEATIVGLAARMSAGDLTAEALTRAYLERIAAVDRGDDGLGSVVETNPEAETIARALDRERAAGKVRGPLHGIPLLVKDNLETADAMATSAGSLALAEHRAQLDSTVVARLRQAGAVILGKANLSEWANFRSFRSTSGWSARGGQCRNPYDRVRNPSGSSSGSAAATSANLCVAAIGTETDGSIVCPASACGVVGLKPTVGLVSRAGIIPIALSQDTAGPIARSVADAAVLLDAIAGEDARDAATHAALARSPRSAKGLDRATLVGARIGVARKFFGIDAGVDVVMEECIAAIAAAGGVIVDTDLSGGVEYVPDEFQVLLHEFKAGLDAFLATVDPRLGVPSLAAIIDFNRRHADVELAHFGQDLLETAVEKGGLDSSEYREARAACIRASRDEGIDRCLAAQSLDAILAPTNSPAWLIDYASGDGFAERVFSARPAAVAGYPSITVPAGFVDDLPVGISFIGRAWSERSLLRIAYAFEQERNARRPPA